MQIICEASWDRFWYLLSNCLVIACLIKQIGATTGVRFEYDFIDIPPEMVGVDFEDEEGEELEQILGQIYIHFLNMELEHRKEESEDGKTRRYDFTKPFV